MRARARRVLLGGLAVLAVLATPVSARADAVTDWNAVAAAALQSPGTAMPPGAGQGAVSTAHLAMVHAAVYDAVNAIADCHETYASAPAAEPWYSQDAAVAAAARHVLVNGDLGVPAARLPVIEAAYQSALVPIADGPAPGRRHRDRRSRRGRAARGARRRRSLRAVPLRGVDAAGRLAAGAAGDGHRPGGMAQGRQAVRAAPRGALRRPATRRLSSLPYAADFNEVKTIGVATGSTRTPDQTAAAEYWGTTNATATMASIIRSVADTQGGTMADHARLLAHVYTNAADALIVTWGDKARYSSWRPFTAIREAASEGNDATEPDPNWTALIGAPPYPEHPGGLSTFGGAVVKTMRHFYGRDQATYTGTTPGDVTRQFTSFSQLRDDIVEARIWSGIHFRFADEEAARIGRKVARWGNRHAFR